MIDDEPAFSASRSHFHRYLLYAVHILSNYPGQEPFHLYLKKYFSSNKKHGSRDRKQIATLCYQYFRLGFGVPPALSVEEKLMLASFLLDQEPSSCMKEFNPEWNNNIHLLIDKKLEMVKDIFDPEKIFPFPLAVSDQIHVPDFSLSFLFQPKLFIRIRPGYQSAVYDKLKSARIRFEKMNDYCLAFDNNEKLGGILKIDQEAVVQDYNSQQTLLQSVLNIQPSAITSVWDCCAASGGKSILAFDLFKNIKLTVSDTRENILENLQVRFEKAGIKNYHSFVGDLSSSQPSKNTEGKLFDLVIADVPCSGSGTWSRTPEQIHFFKKGAIPDYAALQKRIIANVSKSLNENGYLLYITCSVFREENEENVDFIQKELKLRLIQSSYLRGYKIQADTLFVALFTNSEK